MVHECTDLSLDDVHLLELYVCKSYGKSRLDLIHPMELDYRYSQDWAVGHFSVGSIGTTCSGNPSISWITIGNDYNLGLEFDSFSSYHDILHPEQ